MGDFLPRNGFVLEDHEDSLEDDSNFSQKSEKENIKLVISGIQDQMKNEKEELKKVLKTEIILKHSVKELEILLATVDEMAAMLFEDEHGYRRTSDILN